MTGRFTILGAGVVGLAVATELAARGATADVFDPKTEPGGHQCSWWAGGMLAPFCEGETAEPVVVRLGREAADWWQAAGVPVIRRGSLVVTPDRDARELDRFARRTTGHRWLDAEALAETEPALAGRFSRALHFPDEAHLTPREALRALHGRLSVRRAPPNGGRMTGPTLDCRGLAARDALPDLRGVRGEMAVLRCPAFTLTRPVRLLHPRCPLYVVPHGGGVFMLGATQIESDHRGPATLRSVMELLGAAYALDPALAEAEVQELGADARPAFPDNLPRIRQRGQTTYVNGLFRHGFLLAPALARRAADLVLDGRKSEVVE